MAPHRNKGYTHTHIPFMYSTKYLILAIGDLSKSQKNPKIDNENHRNITVEADEINEPIWNRTSISSNGCMKLILKQIEPPTDDLITAFEFEGSLQKTSGLDANSLVGCCLIIKNIPDICRGILLLKAFDCQVIRTLTNNTVYNTHENTHDNNVYNTHGNTVYNTHGNTVYNTHGNSVYNTYGNTVNVGAVYNNDTNGDIDGLGDDLIDQLLDDDFSFVI